MAMDDFGWMIGLAIYAVGRSSMALAANLQRLSLRRESAKPPALRRRKERQPLLVAGIALYAGSGIFLSVALIFASPTLLAPCGTIIFVANAIFAQMLNDERFSWRGDGPPIALIVAGVGAVVAAAPKHNKEFTNDELQALCKEPSFVGFLVFLVTWIVFMYVLSRCLARPKAAMDAEGEDDGEEEDDAYVEMVSEAPAPPVDDAEAAGAAGEEGGDGEEGETGGEESVELVPHPPPTEGVAVAAHHHPPSSPHRRSRHKSGYETTLELSTAFAISMSPRAEARRLDELSHPHGHPQGHGDGSSPRPGGVSLADRCKSAPEPPPPPLLPLADRGSPEDWEDNKAAAVPSTIPLTARKSAATASAGGRTLFHRRGRGSSGASMASSGGGRGSASPSPSPSGSFSGPLPRGGAAAGTAVGPPHRMSTGSSGAPSFHSVPANEAFADEMDDKVGADGDDVADDATPPKPEYDAGLFGKIGGPKVLVWYMSFGMLAGGLGGLNITFTKSIFSLIIGEIENNPDGFLGALKSPALWIIGLTLGGTYVTQMACTTNGLDRTPAMIFVPTQSVTEEGMAVLGGLFFFQDFKLFTALTASIFFVGAMCTVAATVLLTLGQLRRNADALVPGSGADADDSVTDVGDMDDPTPESVVVGSVVAGEGGGGGEAPAVEPRPSRAGLLA